MSKIFYTNIFQQYGTMHTFGYQDGQRFHDETEFTPYLFLPTKEATPTSLRTLEGTPVARKEFKTVKQFWDFVKKHREIEGYNFYGLTDLKYVFLNDNFPGKIDFDLSCISVVSLDIEVESDNGGFPDVDTANCPVTAITLTRNKQTLTFGYKFYQPKKPNNRFILCENEEDMLEKFLGFWQDDEFWRPDVVTGWNCIGFDVPYLIHRVQRLFGEEAIGQFSPIGQVNTREVIRGKTVQGHSFNARKELIYEIAGIAVLDYLELYKKFTFANHESYALNNIAKNELNKNKVDYSEYGSLDNLYEKNSDLFYSYNIEDALIVEQLEDKLNFIKQAMSIAYRAKVNYEDALKTTRPWDVIIHNYLLEKGIVVPYNKPKETRELIGGYVKEVKGGMYENVLSVDYDSLYPNLISQHNISPETFIGKTKLPSIEHMVERGIPKIKEDVSVCANGCVYRKDKRGFLPELVDQFIAERIEVKNKMIELKKEIEKINEELGRRNNQIDK